MGPEEIKKKYHDLNKQVRKVEFLPYPPRSHHQVMGVRHALKTYAFQKNPPLPRKLDEGLKEPVASTSRNPPYPTKKPNTNTILDPCIRTKGRTKMEPAGRQCFLVPMATQTELKEWEPRPKMVTPPGPKPSLTTSCQKGSHKLLKCGKHLDNKAQTDNFLSLKEKVEIQGDLSFPRAEAVHKFLKFVESGQKPETPQPLYIMTPTKYQSRPEVIPTVDKVEDVVQKTVVDKIADVAVKPSAFTVADEIDPVQHQPEEDEPKEPIQDAEKDELLAEIDSFLNKVKLYEKTKEKKRTPAVKKTIGKKDSTKKIKSVVMKLPLSQVSKDSTSLIDNFNITKCHPRIMWSEEKKVDLRETEQKKEETEESRKNGKETTDDGSRKNKETLKKEAGLSYQDREKLRKAAFRTMQELQNASQLV